MRKEDSLSRHPGTKDTPCHSPVLLSKDAWRSASAGDEAHRGIGPQGQDNRHWLSVLAREWTSQQCIS